MAVELPLDPQANKIKVAHVATIDLSLRCLLLNQLSSLQESGYATTGISSPGSHVAALEERGIRHIAVPMTRSVSPVSDLLALWRLYDVMRRERFTIVHGHTPKAELLGQLAARLAGVPVVVDTFRGIYNGAEVGPFKRWLFATMARLAASCADVVLCQSREAMDAAVRSGICRYDRIVFLGNGIDIRRFDRHTLNPRDIHRARKQLGLDETRPVIGFVGRLVREKGILDLFDAMRWVRDRIPTAHQGPRRQEEERHHHAARRGAGQGSELGARQRDPDEIQRPDAGRERRRRRGDGRARALGRGDGDREVAGPPVEHGAPTD